MKDNEIKQLNMALKGEHMAIEVFDHYILDAKDEKVKEKLQEVQQQHKFQAVEISERIQKLGGNPVNTSGVAGAFAEIKFKVTPNKYINNNVVKTAIEGERLGLSALKEIEFKLNDNNNSNMIHNMIIENQKIVSDLNSLM